MITVDGELEIGIERDGVYHTRFTMRESTIADAIAAIEKAPADVSNIALRIYKAAEQIDKIGDIEVDGELLMQLSDDDLDPLIAAQDELVKKRKAAKSGSGPTGNSKSSLEGTALLTQAASASPLLSATSTSLEGENLFQEIDQLLNQAVKPT